MTQSSHRMARVQALAALEVASITKAWAHGPEVLVVPDVEDLPFTASPDTRGVFTSLRVFIVASKARHRIGTTLAHEAIGHAGLRLALGPAAWRRFMLAVHRAACKGGDTFLRRLRCHIRQTYCDERGRRYLKPALEADELVASAAEEVFDRRSGRVLVHDPGIKQAEFALGLMARGIGINMPVDSRQVEGALLVAERTLRDGDPFWGTTVRARRVVRWVAFTATPVIVYSCSAY